MAHKLEYDLALKKEDSSHLWLTMDKKETKFGETKHAFSYKTSPLHSSLFSRHNSYQSCKERNSSLRWTSSNHYSHNEPDDSDYEDGVDKDSDVTSDDADDEDWVAADYDKKRSSRNATSSRASGGNSRKVNASAVPSRQGCQKSRSQRKSGNFNRTTAQVNLTRVGRPAQNLLKSGRSKNQPREHNGAINSMCASGRKTRGHPVKIITADENSSRKREFRLPRELDKPRQCFGPGCTRAAARPDTKYCSDECGLRLAMRRLEVLLPDSVNVWHPNLVDPVKQDLHGTVEPSNCVAQQIDKYRLEEIRAEQCSVHNRLVELEMDHQKLTALINRAQQSKFDKMDELSMAAAAKDIEQVEQMETIICVTCATEVSMRHALKHMEKCFQKMEGNTVFCANQKEQIMGTPLFCDAYDSQARAYCKRLRVVCEHYKEPKLPADTICGCPLVRNVFVETGTFCCVPRHKCTHHFGWERLRRAQIDLERYRCLIRMDELMQEEQRIQHSMSQRGGILGILLHRTIDHNPSKPVPIPAQLHIDKTSCTDE